MPVGFLMNLHPPGMEENLPRTLTKLTPGTLYYVRAFAIVSKDHQYDNFHDQYIVYGNEVTFTTSQ